MLTEGGGPLAFEGRQQGWQKAETGVPKTSGRGWIPDISAPIWIPNSRNWSTVTETEVGPTWCAFQPHHFLCVLGTSFNFWSLNFFHVKNEDIIMSLFGLMLRLNKNVCRNLAQYLAQIRHSERNHYYCPLWKNIYKINLGASVRIFLLH